MRARIPFPYHIIIHTGQSVDYLLGRVSLFCLQPLVGLSLEGFDQEERYKTYSEVCPDPVLSPQINGTCIESWFRDPDKVKIIESKVRDYEERVQVIAKALAKQEIARALDQKHRLEEKINELNSQTKNQADEIRSIRKSA